MPLRDSRCNVKRMNNFLSSTAVATPYNCRNKHDLLRFPHILRSSSSQRRKRRQLLKNIAITFALGLLARCRARKVTSLPLLLLTCRFARQLY